MEHHFISQPSIAIRLFSSSVVAYRVVDLMRALNKFITVDLTVLALFLDT